MTLRWGPAFDEPAVAPIDWESAYRRAAPAIHRFLRRLVGSMDADDLLHDCFVRAMSAKRVPAKASELTPWLYRIATNGALDRLRQRRRRLLLPLVFAAARQASPQTDEESDLVRQALLMIPPDQAVTLVLRLHEGRSRREVAELLGVSEETVKSRLARGRLRFTSAYDRLTEASRR